MVNEMFKRAAQCACVFLATAASAQTINVPHDYDTIQQAIDAAMTGDQIVVWPGVYQENLLIEFKAITLVGMSGSSGTTVQAADSQQPVLQVAITDGEGVVTIDGLTFTGGMGGARFDFADAVIKNCVMHDNPGGSGIRMFWSTIEISNCTITANGSSDVQGGGIFADLCTFSMHGTTIVENRASSGGGVRLVETIMDVDNCIVRDNEADNGGGLLTGLATVTIRNTLLTRNVALDSGGAIALAEMLGTTLQLRGCRIEGNSAVTGGGIHVGNEVIVEIGASSFCGNTPEDISGNWTDLGDNTFDENCQASADLNGDGVVNVSDLLILFRAWGECPVVGDCPADLNGDGEVNASDLMILLSKWGS